MHALGKHLLVELHDCPPEALKRVETVRDILVGAANACGATIVNIAFHEFNPSVESTRKPLISKG